MQGETASVVKKEKRPAVLDVVVDRTHSEFISDAVSGSHKLGIGKRGELVGFLYGGGAGSFIDTEGNVV